MIVFKLYLIGCLGAVLLWIEIYRRLYFAEAWEGLWEYLLEESETLEGFEKDSCVFLAKNRTITILLTIMQSWVFVFSYYTKMCRED